MNASGKIAGTNEEYGIYLGDGNNTLTVGTNISNSNVTTGSGNDVVTVGQWQHVGDSYITNHSNVNLGDGNNKLTVGTNIDSSKVTTGSGDDVIKVGGYVKNSTIDLGSGDDTIEVGKIISNSNINGGDSYDTLAITNPGTSINLDSIADHAHNFEELNISNKSQNTTLSVKLSDVISLTDGDNTLKITADAGDKVEFKDAGWKKVNQQIVALHIQMILEEQLLP